MPQPALSQVSVLSPRSLAHEAGSSLLPVPYAHVVLPCPNNWRRSHSATSVCFTTAVPRRFRDPAGDRRRSAPSGARIGVLAVLHTWSQNLRHHPHLHCLVPAGGLALDRSRWVEPGVTSFYLCVCSAACFAASCSAFLKQSYRRNELCFSGTLTALSPPRAFHSLLPPCAKGVGGRLEASLRWARTRAEVSGPLYPPRRHLQRKAAQPRQRTGALPLARLQAQQPQRHDEPRCVEFIRRFLLHVLPAGFVKIRHFGLLANRNPARPSPCAGAISTPPPRTSAHCLPSRRSPH